MLLEQTRKDSNNITSLGSPFQRLTAPVETFFFTSDLNLPSCHLRPSLQSITAYTGEEDDPTSTSPLFSQLQRARRPSLSLLFSRLNNPSSLSRSP